MSDNSVIKRLAPVFARVDRQIREHLHSDVPYVVRVCEHIIFSGGKRLRPTLFVLSANLCGYRGRREYYFSSAVEYVHAATLLHDDVIDEADTRRGRPAAHTVYGNMGVILVGDFLFAKALGLAAEMDRMIFTRVMSRTLAMMSEGEVLQMLNAGNVDITEAEYENVIHRKTGVLIETCCHLGAVLAEASEEHTRALEEYGRQIGTAFQIMDDNLDYTTTAAEFGKPVGHDLDEGKITLPLIRTLAAASGADREELVGLIRLDKRTDHQFARIKEIIDQYDGLGQSAARAAEAVSRARAALDVFPDSQEKQDLIDLAGFIISRRK